MANNYTQFSTIIENLSPDQIKWIETRLNDREYSVCPCEFESTKDGLWLYASEGCDLDELSNILVDFTKQFPREEPIIITWAETCSKMRVDEFGGGAFAVYKGCLEWFHPHTLAEQWVKEQKAQGV